jgi:hypothetical protein
MESSSGCVIRIEDKLMLRSMCRSLGVIVCVSACGGASSSTTTATSAQPTHSLAFKGEECHGVWQRPKDAKGHDLPWDSTEGAAGAPWAKGAALPDAPKEKLVLGLVCFDAIAGEDTFKRYVQFDDRRFDPNEAAILIDECVESGKCTSDEVIAGPLAWYGHQLPETRLSAASKHLEISQEARDAFVDRTLSNIGKLDAFVASLTEAQRAYLVDIPNAIHEARATYTKGHSDEYTRFDRILEKPDVGPLTVLRSDLATQCGAPQKCSYDPAYREISRALVRLFITTHRPFEAKTVELALGPIHAGRATTASQIWASQTAYRKIHPEVKAPLPVTEEAPDETAALGGAPIEIVQGVIAAVASLGHGTSKVTLKDPTPTKHCDETTDIEGFDGAIEQTRVLYKSTCADVPPGPKVVPFAVADVEVTGIKPGASVLAVATGSGPTRKGAIAQVIIGDKIVQLGPDRFLQASGDPLKGQP